MRIAAMVRPEGGAAEATKLTGEPTVAPFAGEETVIPLVPGVGAGVDPLTLMFTVLLKTVPAAFHPCTMAVWVPAGRGTEALMERLVLLKFVLLKVYML